MRRKRGRAGSEHPSKEQRIVIVVLVVANVAACLASFHCLRLLGQAETATSYPNENFDLSGLYEDEDSVQAPALRVASGNRTSQTTTVHDVGQVAAGLAPQFAITPVNSPSDAKVHDALPPTPSEKLGEAGAKASGSVVHTAAVACWPCGGAVRGPLPTTLRTMATPTAVGCSWKQHAGTFLKDVSKGIDTPYELHLAKELCVDLVHDCFGITCSTLTSGCTVRSGTNLQKSPNGAETTYVKDCVQSCEGTVQPVSPTWSSDLRGAAIVILAHNRAESLKACLDSLLSLVDVGLFNLYVSLDDVASRKQMEAVVQDASRRTGATIKIWEVDPVVPNPTKHNHEQIKWFAMNAGKIAHHYWVAFERTFMEHNYEHAVFVEEDLVFSPDFLALFRSTKQLLDIDPTLWCVSSWNDAGMAVLSPDSCRLFRTSYFPGLGFLLTRNAWLRLRTLWPTTPTMGWDYWMRMAFQREEKECVMPEMPRSHHGLSKGSSVTTEKQLKLFSSMAFANIINMCGSAGPCHQFGDVSYLVSEAYEKSLRAAIQQLPRMAVQELLAGNFPEKNMKPDAMFVVPYVFEEYQTFVELVGLRPPHTKHAIPSDIRSLHYGALYARHVKTRVRLLLVDRRSSRGYLNPTENIAMGSNSRAVAGVRGASCTGTCALRGEQCNNNELYFVNTCKALEQHFGCEAGCAHQVGKELPVYVPDETQPTYRQCLATLVSPMHCEASHASTARLCACTRNSTPSA